MKVREGAIVIIEALEQVCLVGAFGGRVGGEEGDASPRVA